MNYLSRNCYIGLLFIYLLISCSPATRTNDRSGDQVDQVIPIGELAYYELDGLKYLVRSDSLSKL